VAKENSPFLLPSFAALCGLPPYEWTPPCIPFVVTKGRKPSETIPTQINRNTKGIANGLKQPSE